MNRNKIIVQSPISLALLITLSFCTVAGSSSEEMRTVYDMKEHFLGLEVSVEAPYEANPGENITVTVRADASDVIYVEYIYVNIYGFNETEEISLANITCAEKENLNGLRTVDQIVTIPNDTSPGLTYGIMRWKWKSPQLSFPGVGFSLEVAPPFAGFIVTYVKNIELEELQSAYDALNETYHSLLGNGTDLESDYQGELTNTRNLMYAFIATTVVSAATAVFLMIRKTKARWE